MGGEDKEEKERRGGGNRMDGGNLLFQFYLLTVWETLRQ